MMFRSMTFLNRFRYLMRFRSYRYIFLVLLSSFLLFMIIPSLNKLPVLNSSIPTYDFLLYSQSRPWMEYERIRIDRLAQPMFNLTQLNVNENIDSTRALPYSESLFRSASFPIIWIDNYGDVHWNIPAQMEMLNYLSIKQYPRQDLSTCLNEQLFLLEQWPMGFFSRHHCFIDQFGQTLYSPSMTLLMPKRFQVSGSGTDDFLHEGILRYYQSFSFCSLYLSHPDLKQLRQQIQSMTEGDLSNVKIMTNIKELLEHDEKTVKYKYSREVWKFSYDHVPHRRWLFDRNRKQLKKTLTYHSPSSLLINHSNEHIYYPEESSTFNLTTWHARNSPQEYPTDFLPGANTQLTIEDQIFSSFLRYIFILFFSPLAPRIQASAKLLAHHWSEYLSDKWQRPYNEVLTNMAALFIRRGDKMPEDSFWQKHYRWRNISMYVKGIVDEEKRRGKKFSAIFAMTDDTSVMNSIQEYARIGLTRSNRDEVYARKHLYRRQILYNVFAPQSCFNPFIRIGFDQFLVNVQFLTDHVSFIVGHTDSNVARYLEEIIYVHRHHHKHARTRTFFANAPDSLD